jgi:hypothetical protein
MFAIPEYHFTATEHDADRPWIVYGSQHHSVTLDEAMGFFEWVHDHFPPPRWSVELDPYQLSPGGPRPKRDRQTRDPAD